MHPFGGTPICPKCSKAVYAAEQAMGPGRKLYHKPCLSCTSCNKRLDSFSLLEHDQQPYCKSCHSKLFGTRDLRQANLPHLPDMLSSPPTSPTKSEFGGSPQSSPVRRTFSPVRSLPPALRPTRALSPTAETFMSRGSVLETVADGDEGVQADGAHAGEATSSMRGAGGLPRTVPLSPTKPRFTGNGFGSPVASPATMARMHSTGSSRGGPEPTSPLMPTATGTRYGAALGGAAPLVPSATGTRQWGGTTPKCPRCKKNVYFAEQVKAAGKTWHKACLRCAECSTMLDSTRLTEKDGEPLCHRCYNKLHGPQGNGYALLGKAGG